MLERLARASGKHLGESSSIFSESVREICTTDVAKVEREAREECNHEIACGQHCGPDEDGDDHRNTLSGDGGTGTGSVGAWKGGPVKGTQVRFFAVHILSDTYSAEARTVTYRFAREQQYELIARGRLLYMRRQKLRKKIKHLNTYHPVHLLGTRKSGKKVEMAAKDDID